jgi:hypothetical protein
MSPPDDTSSSHSASDIDPKEELQFQRIKTGTANPPLTRTGTNRTTSSLRDIHSHQEASDFANLPYRTLTNNAAIEEYTEETTSGQILKEVKSNRTGRIERYELVTWKINDPENPKNWSKAYKWWCTMVVALTCFVVAFNSAVITADISGPAEDFGVSDEVSLLAVTLFVIGFGVGESIFASIVFLSDLLI